MHTGIFSPRSAISRQCAAPTLCRCQCMASVFRPVCMMRYIPTLRMPRFGSRVITMGNVMYAPPSSGQHLINGSLSRSTSSPRQTISWQGARPRRIRGGNLPTSSSRGSIDSLPINPSGTFSSSSSVIRAPTSSSDSTPSDMLMRRIDPNRLIATGNADGAPSIRTACSNSSALPPPGCFMTRSAISHSSRFTRHGLRDANQLAGLFELRDESSASRDRSVTCAVRQVQ